MDEPEYSVGEVDQYFQELRRPKKFRVLDTYGDLTPPYPEDSGERFRLRITLETRDRQWVQTCHSADEVANLLERGTDLLAEHCKYSLSIERDCYPRDFAWNEIRQVVTSWDLLADSWRRVDARVLIPRWIARSWIGPTVAEILPRHPDASVLRVFAFHELDPDLDLRRLGSRVFAYVGGDDSRPAVWREAAFVKG